MQSFWNWIAGAALWFRRNISQERLKNKSKAWPKYQLTLQKRVMPLMLLNVAQGVVFFIIQRPDLAQKSNATNDTELILYLAPFVSVFRIMLFGLGYKFPCVIKVFHAYETVALGC